MPQKHKHDLKRKPIKTLYMHLFILINLLKHPLVLLGILVQLVSRMKGFVNYAIPYFWASTIWRGVYLLFPNPQFRYILQFFSWYGNKIAH